MPKPFKERMKRILCYFIGHRLDWGLWRPWGGWWIRDETCSRCRELSTWQVNRTKFKPLDIVVTQRD